MLVGSRIKGNSKWQMSEMTVWRDFPPQRLARSSLVTKLPSRWAASGVGAKAVAELRWDFAEMPPLGHEPQELREVLGSRSTVGSSIMRRSFQPAKGQAKKAASTGSKTCCYCPKKQWGYCPYMYSLFLICMLYSLLPNELYAQDFQASKYTFWYLFLCIKMLGFSSFLFYISFFPICLYYVLHGLH